MKSKVIVILGILVIASIVTGCGLREYRQKRYRESNEYKTERMLEHIEEKYGEKFEMVYAGSSTFMNSFYEIIVVPESHPDLGITVQYHDMIYGGKGYKRGKEERIADDYMSYLMHEELETELTEVLEGVFEEYKVYKSSTSSTLADEIRPGYSAKEYMQTKYNQASFSIVTSKSIEEREMDLERIYEVLKENKYMISFNLIYIQGEAFGELGEDDYNTTMRPKDGVTNALICCIVDKNLELIRNDWRYDE